MRATHAQINGTTWEGAGFEAHWAKTALPRRVRGVNAHYKTVRREGRNGDAYEPAKQTTL